MTEVQPNSYDRTDGTTWVDQIPWDRFEADKVDPEQLKTVKAAALVEFNAHDYATYLTNVFPDDEDFKKAAWEWAAEEVLHGIALGRWAKLADPSFDFEAAIKRFREGFSLPLDAKESVRGSRSGELVARCIVEVGTSSFYTAFGQAMAEPVFRKICTRIAADEFRHYKLFYTHLKRYLERDRIGRFGRLKIAIGRIAESEDDELAYAFYAGNAAGPSCLARHRPRLLVPAPPPRAPVARRRAAACLQHGLSRPRRPPRLSRQGLHRRLRAQARRAASASSRSPGASAPAR
jgi:hypothetical protein